MKRLLIIGMGAVLASLGAAGSVQAQVFVRAPFVRVQVGPDIHVRAPFVDIYIPRRQPPIYVAPIPETAPPPGVVPEGTPPVEGKADLAPPQPPEGKALTIEQFAKTFQPKAGSYEVALLNPVTKQATTVRFSLPEGAPRRVATGRNDIEFRYGPRQFVHIEFDKDGALVTSR